MWNAFQIILVLGLSLPERASGRNLSHDFTRPQPGSLHVGDCSFGDALLFVARIEDRRAIAEPHIMPLTIFRGRVVDLEEELEQPPIANFGGIKNDLDSFSVSSVITVGSVRDVSTGVPHPRRDHSVEPSNKVLHTP